MGASLALSVILLSPDRYASVRHMLDTLLAQTARERIELVLVAPAVTGVEVDTAEAARFGAWQVVEGDPGRDSTAARAAGIRAARAPLVAFTEDHVVPEPEWAAALIAAHAEPWAAVGPVIVNANPATLTSWANLLVEYAPFLPPVQRGPVEYLPGHNSSYKRDLLIAYGDRLERLLEAESVLHWDLRARGHQLLLEPAARVRHLNCSAPGAWLPLRYHAGRQFAACRAAGWRPWRRLLYAGASPLIPLVRLQRIVRGLRASGDPQRLLPRILPLLLGVLVVSAVGEAVGYLADGGDATAHLSDLEFDRGRLLTAHDRQTAWTKPHAT